MEILKIENLNVWYGKGAKRAVSDVNVTINKNEISAIMGPSGCGKSTLLRAINLMHSLYEGVRVEGKIIFNNQNILDCDPIDIRRKIGMVFQRPNPFPTMSIADNVIAGYILSGEKLTRIQKNHIVEECLRSVGLWDEVKDVTEKRGTFLSGGQMQRLCIARALAVNPEIILMDEPTSALDPISTGTIEKLMLKLKKEVTIIIVTHNMGQAGRISDKSLFMYLGELIESGTTKDLFLNPKDRRTKAFLTGRIS